MRKYLIMFIALFLEKINYSMCAFSHSREKRFLVVPPTSPTRHQLISGIGIPLQLKEEAITLGITMKAQYLLPDVNATSLKPVFMADAFNTSGPGLQIFQSQNNQNSPFPSYYGRRKRSLRTSDDIDENVEIYDVKAEQVGNEELKDDEDDEEFEDEYPGEYEYEYERFPMRSDYPQPNQQALADTSGTRWLMYDGFADLLHKQGINGRDCVLKSICEASEVKFTHHSGIFGELFHILLTPSSSHDEITRKEHSDYAEAEKIGASGRPCGEMYKSCEVSVMDMISQILI